MTCFWAIKKASLDGFSDSFPHVKYLTGQGAFLIWGTWNLGASQLG